MTKEILPASDPQEEIETLREQISELQRELTAARKSPDASAAELSELRRQLDEAKGELAALRPPSSPAAPSGRRLDGFFQVEE